MRAMNKIKEGIACITDGIDEAMWEVKRLEDEIKYLRYGISEAMCELTNGMDHESNTKNAYKILRRLSIPK